MNKTQRRNFMFQDTFENENLEFQNPEPQPEPEPSPFIDPKSVQLPGKGWGVHELNDSHFYIKVDEQCRTTHILQVKADRTMTLKVGRNHVEIPGLTPKAESPSDLTRAMKEADELKPCEGNGYQGFSKQCVGGVKKGIRCIHCREYRKSQRKKIKRNTTKKRKQNARERSKRLYTIKKQRNQLKDRVSFMRGANYCPL